MTPPKRPGVTVDSVSYCNACGFAKRGLVKATFSATLQWLNDRGRVLDQKFALLCDHHLSEALEAKGVVVVKYDPLVAPPGSMSIPLPKPAQPDSEDPLVDWYSTHGVNSQTRAAITRLATRRTNLLGEWKLNAGSKTSKNSVGDFTLATIVGAWLAGHIDIYAIGVDSDICRATFPMLEPFGDAGMPLERLSHHEDDADGWVRMLRAAHPHIALRVAHKERPCP